MRKTRSFFRHLDLSKHKPFPGVWGRVVQRHRFPPLPRPRCILSHRLYGICISCRYLSGSTSGIYIRLKRTIQKRIQPIELSSEAGALRGVRVRGWVLFRVDAVAVVAIAHRLFPVGTMPTRFARFCKGTNISLGYTYEGIRIPYQTGKVSTLWDNVRWVP